MEDSLQGYQSDLQQARKQGDRASEMGALEQIGNVYLAMNRPDEALSTFDMLVKLAHEADARQIEAAALMGLGTAAVDSGDGERALTALQEALAIKETLGSSRDQEIALSTLGAAHVLMGQIDEGIACYSRALTLAEGDAVGKAKILIRLGLAHAEKGDYTSGLRILEEALDLMREVGDQQGVVAALLPMAHTNLNFGLELEDSGNIKEALVHVEAARAIYAELKRAEAVQTEAVLNRLREKSDKPGLLGRLFNS